MRCSARRPLADPAGRGAARLPAVPAAGGVPAGVPRRASRLVERAGAGVRRSATPGWRSSASRRASTAPTAPAGRSPAICRRLLYATLLKFGLAEGEYRADPADGLRLDGRDHPQRGQMPAAGQQAEPQRDRHLPQLSRSRAGGAAEGAGAGRARPDRPCRRGAGARPAAVGDQVRPRRRACRARRPRPAVELSLLALQPEHRRLDAAMFESVFERALQLELRCPRSAARKAPAGGRGRSRRRRGASWPRRGRASATSTPVSSAPNSASMSPRSSQMKLWP